MALLSFISSAEAQCVQNRRKVQQIMHICDNELHDYILQTSRAKTDFFWGENVYLFGPAAPLEKN